MRTKVGLWIDHRKTLIVAVTDKGEEIRLIISKVENSPDVPVVCVLRLPMKHSKCRQMIAARESLRDI